MIKIFLVCIIFCCCTKVLIAQNNTLVKDTSNGTFKRIEVEAEFPGGQGAWGSFLRKNLKANVPFKKGALAGTYVVIVKFIIGKDGTINEVTPETNHGYGMENELVRVIKKGQKWIPATLNGVAVRAYIGDSQLPL